jgi:hypothetical protein
MCRRAPGAQHGDHGDHHPAPPNTANRRGDRCRRTVGRVDDNALAPPPLDLLVGRPPNERPCRWWLRSYVPGAGRHPWGLTGADDDGRLPTGDLR